MARGAGSYVLKRTEGRLETARADPRGWEDRATPLDCRRGCIDITSLPHDRIDELVVDGLLVDLHRAELRVAELEAEHRWAREAIAVAVTMIRRLLHTVDRLQDRQHRHDDELAELRQELTDIVTENAVNIDTPNRQIEGGDDAWI